MVTDVLELSGLLGAALQERGLHGEVVGLERLTGGASRDTWAFELRFDGADRQRFVLQRARPGGIRTGVGMAGEAELVRAAAAAGVPVPEVIAWSTEPDDIAEAWAVSRWVEGESIPRRILRSLADDEEAGRALTGQLGRAAAAVHRIDRERVPHLHAEDQVTQFRDLLDAMGQPSPAFELGLRWLEDNRPDPIAPTVVHGDLRLGNLLVAEAGLVAVVDWELAHVGDPTEDLAWPCVRAWRFGADLPVGGFGEREDLHAAYEAESGTVVDRERVHWWEALSTLKWGIMCILQSQTHLSGMNRSVELAAIGRRVCENEYDLLHLTHPHLAGGSTAGPEAPAEGTGLHGRPTAAELVEAVQEFLRSDVLDAVEGRVRFHTRVAANVLGIVERELAEGAGAEAAHAERLARLGVADEAGLAAAIRDGSLADRIAEVEVSVWRSVVAKLAVANPDHLLA